MSNFLFLFFFTLCKFFIGFLLVLFHIIHVLFYQIFNLGALIKFISWISIHCFFLGFFVVMVLFVKRWCCNFGNFVLAHILLMMCMHCWHFLVLSSLLMKFVLFLQSFFLSLELLNLILLMILMMLLFMFNTKFTHFLIQFPLSFLFFLGFLLFIFKFLLLLDCIQFVLMLLLKSIW